VALRGQLAEVQPVTLSEVGREAEGDQVSRVQWDISTTSFELLYIHNLLP